MYKRQICASGAAEIHSGGSDHPCRTSDCTAAGSFRHDPSSGILYHRGITADHHAFRPDPGRGDRTGRSKGNGQKKPRYTETGEPEDVYKRQILEEELQGKEKELYDLKHELISAQIKLENAENQGKELQKQLNEDAKKIVRLETELKDK